MSESTGPASPRIIAITNQKGGVGKTTTAINLAAGLVETGARVLLVDLDPQGNASTGLGIAPEDRVITTYDLLLEGKSVADVMRGTDVPGLMICPANADLSSADLALATGAHRSLALRNALRHPGVAAHDFGFILIDCPPSLSLLTVNALVAADSVLVPLQSEFFALEGLSQLMLTIRDIRAGGNPDLRIEGVVLTMFDGRNRLSLQVESDARETLGDLVFRTVVPRNVRVSEAPSFAKSVLAYDPQSKGSDAYRALARELAARHGAPPAVTRGAA
jgi:chromosome partitioning protein